MLHRGKSIAVIHDETGDIKPLLPKPIGITGYDDSATRPSPFQFEKFVPWVCSQWCASTAVLVTKLIQERYIKFDARKQSRSVRKSKAVNVPQPIVSPIPVPGPSPKAKVPSSDESLDDEGSFHSEILKKAVKRDKIVPIKAYYDDKQNLVEIAIIGAKTNVSRKVIHALSLCIPYYPMLNRFTFRKGGLTDEVIYEINKLIPISNITELFFDNSYVKQSNYYILLEQFSQLKYLSLNQCWINDDACIKLFANLDFNAPSANSLQIIELGTNQITDVGAKFIGTVLKMNRCLLHINLSGNKITDHGFKYILESLMEFPLTPEENMAMKRRRLVFLHNKIAVYKRCLYELQYGHSDDVTSSSSSRKSFSARKLRRKSKKAASAHSVVDIAENMAKRIVGDFMDPYSPDHTELKDDVIYAKGNLILCSLNIAYNDLTYLSVRKLAEVVSYQNYLEKAINETGLIRVTIDGNNIPVACTELDDIDDYLKNVVTGRLPSLRKTRTSSLLKKVTSGRQYPTTTFST